MGIELFIGTDESNNGRALEIHTAVFSMHLSDAHKTPEIMPKLRAHKNIHNRLRNRSYSFLLFTDADKRRIAKNQRLGAITSSLLYEELDYSDLDKLNIYFDGYKGKLEIETAQDMISDRIGLSTEKIKILFGPKFDQYYPVVNIADQLAHYIFRKPAETLSEHKNRRELIY